MISRLVLPLGMSTGIGPTVLVGFGSSCSALTGGAEPVGMGAGLDDVGVEGDSVDDGGDDRDCCGVCVTEAVGVIG